MYKVNCKDCNHVYIGETGRDLAVRMKEHRRAFISANENNGMFRHSAASSHAIDFDSSQIIYQASDLKIRRVVEAAYISAHSNNSMNLDSGFFSMHSHLANQIINSIT